MQKKMFAMVLSVCLLAGICAMPASANLGNSFTADFESYVSTDGSAGPENFTTGVSAADSNYKKCFSDTHGDGTCVRMEQDNASWFAMVYGEGTQYKNHVDLTMSFCPKDFNIERRLYSNGKLKDGNAYADFVLYKIATDGKFIPYGSATDTYALTSGKWYTLNVKFNLEGDHPVNYFYLYDDAGNKVYEYSSTLSYNAHASISTLQFATIWVGAAGYTAGTPSSICYDDISLKEINRYYPTQLSYDFNNFTAVEDENVNPEGFNIIYANTSVNAEKNNSRIFSVATDRGRSADVKIYKHQANWDAPFLRCNDVDYSKPFQKTNVLLESSIYFKNMGASIKFSVAYRDGGTYEMYRAYNGSGDLYFLGQKTNFSCEKERWYDFKLKLNSTTHAARLEVYSEGLLVYSGEKLFSDTETRTAIAYLNYSSALDFTVTTEDEPAEYYIDDIRISETEPLYLTSIDNNIFDIAYSQPISGTKVSKNAPCRVAFSKPVDQTSFNSSTVLLNGVGIGDSDISFEDDYTAVLSFDKKFDSNYHIDFAGIKDTDGATLNDYVEFSTYGAPLIVNSLKFYNADSQEISTVTGGNINAVANIKSSDGFKHKVMYIIALYKGNMIENVKVKYEDIVESDGDKELQLGFEVPAEASTPGSGYSIKAMIWDKNVSPFVDYTEINN